MNLFNFKIAKKLNIHADEIIVSFVGVCGPELLGIAETPSGIYDFSYVDGKFTYFDVAV